MNININKIFKLLICISHTIHIIAIYFSGIFFVLLGLAGLNETLIQAIVLIIIGSVLIVCATDILLQRIRKKKKQIKY
jgi:hypothetical protein